MIIAASSTGGMGLLAGSTTIECALERWGGSAMVGEVLGRYRIVEEIGAGGMGMVFRARDERLGRDLALKVLSPGVLHDEVSRKRFRNEALMLSRLNHPSIQVIHDFDTQDGIDFLVSEFVPGVTLVDKLRAGHLSGVCEIRNHYGVAVSPHWPPEAKGGQKSHT